MVYIQVPSICIPHVWYKFDRNYVEGVFCSLFGPNANGESCVTRIDMIPKKDRNTNKKFWVVFVHFSPQMFSSEHLVDFANRITNDEEIKIYYNQHWFWKVRKNKATRKEHSRIVTPLMYPRYEELMIKQQEVLAKSAASQTQVTEEDIQEAYRIKVLEQAESYREKVLKQQVDMEITTTHTHTHHHHHHPLFAQRAQI
jgi:hypothetical protein